MAMVTKVLLKQSMTTLASEPTAETVQLEDDSDEHAEFASWLAAEETSIVDAVDGQTYGRPITVEGVRHGYTKYDLRFDSRFAWREGTLESVTSFYLASASGNNVGHIDCLVVDSPPMGGPVGWLFMVYVLPEQRGTGVGKLLVELACDKFPVGMNIYCTVARSNPRARKFYESLGFRFMSEQTVPGASIVDVMELVREKRAS
eukprot:gene11074-13091_t